MLFFFIGFAAGFVAAVAGTLFIQHQVQKVGYGATAKADLTQLETDLHLHAAAVADNTTATKANTEAVKATTKA